MDVDPQTQVISGSWSIWLSSPGFHRSGSALIPPCGNDARTGLRVIGMHTFGASAPLKELQKKFGFEPDRVVAVAREVLGRN